MESKRVDFRPFYPEAYCWEWPFHLKSILFSLPDQAAHVGPKLLFSMLEIGNFQIPWKPKSMYSWGHEIAITFSG